VKKYDTEQEKKECPTYSRTMTAKWIGHTLRRKCLLKHVTEGKTEGRSNGKERKRK
jgi:hypothetical protein